MKQNWLLTGVCVGSMILAIMGWTRKVDCGCPKDLNASITNPMKRVAATALGGNDGTGRPLGGPAVIGKGTAGAIGVKPVSHALAVAGFTNAHGPLSVGQGTDGGALRGGVGGGTGSPLDGSGDSFARAPAALPHGGNGYQALPGVDIRNGGGSGGSGTPMPTTSTSTSTSTSSTTGGSQSTSTSGGASTTSGGTNATSGSSTTTSGGATTSGSTSSTSTSTSSSSGGTGKPHGHDGHDGKGGGAGTSSTSSGGGHDDFGPHDPLHNPHDGNHGGHDDFGPHDPNGGKAHPGQGNTTSGGHDHDHGAPGKDGKPDGHGTSGGHEHDHGHGWFDGWGWGNGGATSSGATEVPEPGTLGLLGAGVAGLAFTRWRRRRPKVEAGAQPEITAPDDPAAHI